MLKRINLWKKFNNNLYNKRELKEIVYEDLKNKNYIILDVRNKREYSEGHINRAINIELSKIKKQIDRLKLNKNEDILVYCQSGIRSKKAVLILEELGYKNVYNLKGGLENI